MSTVSSISVSGMVTWTQRMKDWFSRHGFGGSNLPTYLDDPEIVATRERIVSAARSALSGRSYDDQRLLEELERTVSRTLNTDLSKPI